MLAKKLKVKNKGQVSGRRSVQLGNPDFEIVRAMKGGTKGEWREKK